ncbi:MAG TPA: hypothetical protein VML35_09185 [Gaiellaceae bacterium]|nr:hypothetical protein [Gaiellaceae bacterium]
MSTTAAGGRATAAAFGLLDRLWRALPLLMPFLLVSAAYAWQASRQATPWIFTDELEFTQLARSAAETGELARRGEKLTGQFSLYPYLVAPAWWLDDVKSAYEAVKVIGVLVMTLTLFPAYGLARFAVSRPAALLVAIATVSIPAFVYTAMIVEEPLAYFWSTLSLYLIVRSIVTRARRDLALVVAAALVAPLVRDELIVIPAVLAGAWLVAAWESERFVRLRRDWSRADYAGVALLVLGAVLVLNELYSGRSVDWDNATRHWKGRMIEYGLWAGGAFTIGLGVLPVVAGLAAGWRPRDEPKTRELSAFRSVLWLAIIGFGLYTAGKAAIISTTFATRVVERNLIYLAPLLFVATAIVLEHRRVRLLALAASTAFVAFLLLTTPYHMDTRLYSDSPGLAILAAANRAYGWTPEHAESVLLWMLLAAVGVVAAVVFVRGHAIARAIALAAAVLTVGWNATGEVNAARGSVAFADAFMANLPRQPSWVDRATGGEPTLYIGQKIADANGLWLLEFWNRSVKRVWSLDGTAPGPGPALTPDLLSPQGELAADPGYRYAVVERGIEVAGTPLRTEGSWRLYALEPPLRLAAAQRGIFGDGWVGSNGDDNRVGAGFSRYINPEPGPGTAFVTVGRKGWCSDKDLPGNVIIRAGTLVLGPERNGVVGRVTDEAGWQVRACSERTFALSVPPAPFHVEVTIEPTFSPYELDPAGQSDRRRLGAQVSFDWRPGNVTLEEYTGPRE